MWLSAAFALANPVQAQRALHVTRIETGNLPEPLLTLRPQAGLERLAQEVADVLELRTGQRVEVGDPPPPGLLEAVPAGHVAMARQRNAVVLVLGAVGGRSLDATVQLSAAEPADARAIALAAEALRDASMDAPQRKFHAPDDAPTPEREESGADSTVSRSSLLGVRALTGGAASTPTRDDGGGTTRHERELSDKIQPLLYARVYGGASTASTEMMAGVGTGVGLCVRRHCLFLAGEVPFTTGSREHLDVRYRYPTFLSGFYTRPFSFGRFTPGASVGFLTRLGHFQADMGTADTGLDTDLGVRGSLDLGFELVSGLDLMTEGGVDLTLDRNRMSSSEDHLKDRGDRWSPWLQAALRYRL
jgi:hypothetical protein